MSASDLQLVGSRSTRFYCTDHRVCDTGKKKKAGSRVKAAGKSSKGQLSGEAVDAMLDGQQHMLGELNQVILHLC